MTRSNWRVLAGAVLAMAALVASGAACAGVDQPAGSPAAGAAAPAASEFRKTFSVDKANLADTGRNPYFILEPGYKLFFEHGKNTLTIAVMDETKVVDGVKTRVVEERETTDGKLAEVSRNYFAIDSKTRDVYYFGEDTEEYKNGTVDREGSWLSGVGGAKFGLLMPGQPKVGDKFYQELAPKVAMDRCEIVSLSEAFQAPAGKFDKCLKTKDSSDLESGVEAKLYAPGVGLVQDGGMVLVKIEKPKEPEKAPAAGK